MNACEWQNWHNAPAWAKYRAQDANGDWFWYEHMPMLKEEKQIWVVSKGDSRINSSWSKENPEWIYTLEKRPERDTTQTDSPHTPTQEELDDINRPAEEGEEIIATSSSTNNGVPQFAQINKVKQERDQAWEELREIRRVIGANDEESTLDEVKALVHRYLEMKNGIRFVLSRADREA